MESSTYHQPSRVRAKTGSPKVPLVWPSVSRQRQLQSVPLAIVRPWPLAAEAISRPRLETESLEPQSPPRSARPVLRSGGDKCSRDGSLESPGNLGLTFHMNPGLTSQLLNIPAGRRTLPLFIIFFSHHTVQSSSLLACCGTRQQIRSPLLTRSLLRYPQSRTQRALATSKERCSLFWPAP